MGNRAVITTRKDLKDIGVYLHWNGGRDSVEGFLTYCKIKGFRPPEHDNYGWAYLCVTIGNFFGGEGFSLGIDVASKLDCDNWDNGTYIIKTGYTVKSCHDLYHAETAAKAADVPFRAYGKQCKRRKTVRKCAGRIAKNRTTG